MAVVRANLESGTNHRVNFMPALSGAIHQSLVAPKTGTQNNVTAASHFPPSSSAARRGHSFGFGSRLSSSNDSNHTSPRRHLQLAGSDAASDE